MTANHRLPTLASEPLCHTSYDHKAHADLAVEIRAQNLKRKTLRYTKRGPYYA